MNETLTKKIETLEKHIEEIAYHVNELQNSGYWQKEDMNLKSLIARAENIEKFVNLKIADFKMQRREQPVKTK